MWGVESVLTVEKTNNSRLITHSDAVEFKGGSKCYNGWDRWYLLGRWTNPNPDSPLRSSMKSLRPTLCAIW